MISSPPPAPALAQPTTPPVLPSFARTLASRRLPPPSPIHPPLSNNIPEPPLQPPRLLDADPLHPRRDLQLPHVAARERRAVVVHAREAPVLPLEEEAQRQGAGGREDLQADADAQGGPVVRGVRRPVGEGGPDGGGVADGVDEGEGGGALGGGAGDGGGYP